MTPAWPPQSTPRLFVDVTISDGMDIRLEGNQAHYLLHVMRLKEGAPVRLFDDRTGEWLAAVAGAGKRTIALKVQERLGLRESVPDVWLLAAPIKKVRIDMMAEKACELGVARFQPVVTRRTVVDRVNLERLRVQMIEAAEQCGRTALPEIREPARLEAILSGWPAGRQLYFADETGGSPLWEEARPGPSAILIGPEGGFAAEEQELLRSHQAVRAVSLGPRILRAETAAIAALSIWMARAGDWGRA